MTELEALRAVAEAAEVWSGIDGTWDQGPAAALDAAVAALDTAESAP